MPAAPSSPPGSTVSKGETLVGGLVESLAEPSPASAGPGGGDGGDLVRADGGAAAGFPPQNGGGPLLQPVRPENRKKKNKFYFGSGKDIDECDKIVHEYNLGVEGLFALPVSLVREELIRRAPGEGEEDCGAEMESAALRLPGGAHRGRDPLLCVFRHRDRGDAVCDAPGPLP